MKIALLSRSFEMGGAERQLVNLALGLQQRKEVEVAVLAFYPTGVLREELADGGVTIVLLNKRGRWDLLFVVRIIRTLRKHDYDIVHSFLDGPNVLVALLRPFLKKTRIVWSVRSSYVDFSRYDWLARLVYGLSRYLSRIPRLIFFNSVAGRIYHESRGYSIANSTVVRNGINVERFRPSREARTSMRRAWRKPDKTILVGLVGRLDPMKDHPSFLTAASLLRQHDQRTEFVCVGSGSAQYKRRLLQLAADLGVSQYVLWIEEASRMMSVYNALDIVTLSSYGEGFPNAIAEAMACGIPCVVTDTGDCAELVGDTGELVEARNPESLMKGWQRMSARIAEDACGLAHSARARIISRFSNVRMVGETCEHYRRILDQVSG